jgi:hypothetical protein
MRRGRSHRVRHPRIRLVVLIGLAMSLAACYVGEQRTIHSGKLEADISQNAFVRQWGFPARTLSLANEDQLRARWGDATPQQLFRNRGPLDLWVYAKPPAELVFDDGDLIAWKTDQTADQLRAAADSVPFANRFVGKGQHSLQEGLLRVGIKEGEFRDEWGQPDHITLVETAQDLDAQWDAGVGASILQGRPRPVNIWTYDKRGTSLLFDERELVAWKTDRTVKELATSPTEP